MATELKHWSHLLYETEMFGTYLTTFRCREILILKSRNKLWIITKWQWELVQNSKLQNITKVKKHSSIVNK